ncbi:thioredoxin [Actinophytocola algeriensis]|jgi:thioredoxin 1|uniref:Thioredoxin n=1 Tax=Actinophytocola algeriensis TaxID=1768010 RepID=A0A7W7Q767_9PSEU|nr:thioredoxin [Actinophytocola algeriensis]MBB4908300.1 thioredoxin 1 [Actinophytocola algeriensis]MBE1480330.1 thioredoxin 1 [Actinophytocola algeriensis]
MDAVTESTFDSRVLGHDKPVLVEFWATWCGPCRMVAPVLEQIAAERPDLDVVKVNYDEEPAIGQRYGVMGLPTMLLFSGGEPVRSIVGAKPKAKLLSELDEALSVR